MKGKIRVLGFESDCSVKLKPSEVRYLRLYVKISY